MLFQISYYNINKRGFESMSKIEEPKPLFLQCCHFNEKAVTSGGKARICS